MSKILFILTGCLLSWAEVSAQGQPPRTTGTLPKESSKKDETPKKDDKKNPPSLEDLFAQALKNNPDIRLAEAKLRESEAQLNKARLEVMQKVVNAQRNIRAAKAAADEAVARHERAKKLRDQGVIPAEEFGAALLALQQIKADLARAEAELPLLLGEAPPEAGMKRDPELIRRLYLDQLSRLPTVPELTQGRLPSLDEADSRRWWEWRAVYQRIAELPSDQVEKVRKLLDRPIKAQFQEASLKDVCELIQDQVGGINILVNTKKSDAALSLNLREPIPIGALVQWIEDNLPVRFILRDYGLVVVSREQLPPGALAVHELWKNRGEKEKGK